MHINFLCLIVLGKLWRKRIQACVATQKHYAANRARCRALGRRLYHERYKHLDSYKQRVQAWETANTDRRARQARRRGEQRTTALPDSYVKHMIKLCMPEGMRKLVAPESIPDSVVRLKRETVYAKRKLRKEVGIRFSGIKG